MPLNQTRIRTIKGGGRQGGKGSKAREREAKGMQGRY